MNCVALATVKCAPRSPDYPAVRLPRLTTREQQVLSLIADSHRTSEVVKESCYRDDTAKSALDGIVIRLNVRTRAQAVACAMRDGVI